ncbi:hypothetical protein PAPHI01_0322 [Pancytospora philotis]|nr:hypothetical protein PAPHI01_0322 [Pancytospora philotis]
MFIHRLLSLQLEKDRSKPVIFSLALNHMASHYNRGFIELLTSSLVRNSNMGRILNYICASNAKDADPHFVRGYLEAQRKNGKITEEQEVVYLHTYYSNCGDAKRGKLLAVDDKFPESLPYEFRQRVCDSLYEEACTKDSGIAAVMQAKYDSNPDRNDRSRHMAKIDAYLEFYRPTVEPTNAEQGVACSPSMGMAESP